MVLGSGDTALACWTEVGMGVADNEGGTTAVGWSDTGG
jgi:hypothetical protein